MRLYVREKLANWRMRSPRSLSLRPERVALASGRLLRVLRSGFGSTALGGLGEFTTIRTRHANRFSNTSPTVKTQRCILSFSPVQFLLGPCLLYRQYDYGTVYCLMINCKKKVTFPSQQPSPALSRSHILIWAGGASPLHGVLYETVVVRASKAHLVSRRAWQRRPHRPRRRRGARARGGGLQYTATVVW